MHRASHKVRTASLQPRCSGRFFSSRYCVAIEYGVATAGLVAMIFNIELVVAIFCSLRCHVNIEFRVATIRFVAKFFFSISS